LSHSPKQLLQHIIVLGIVFFAATDLDGQPLPDSFNHSIRHHTAFIENKGQIRDQYHKLNTEVIYLLKANGMNVQLRRNGFSYDTYETRGVRAVSSNHESTKNITAVPDSVEYRFHRIDIQLVGANISPQIMAQERSETYSTYYTAGNNHGVRVYCYSRIVYKEIYPGIDLVFDSRTATGENGFEYYFIVSPGADANQIIFKYNGAKTTLENHNIIIHSSNGKLQERIPYSFLTNTTIPLLIQPQRNSLINVEYKQTGKGLFKFVLPSYDKTKTLVVDPTPDLVWGTYYGRSNNDFALNIARDPTGNILVAGSSGNDNLATTGAYQTVLNGYADGLIGKFRSDGSLVWMTYFGGESADEVFDICSDNSGNIFVVGITDSKTGVSTPGSFQPSPGDPVYGRDAFIARFDGSGNRIWSTYYGGSDIDYLHGTKVDAAGNLFVAGWTFSPNGIASPGAFQTSYASDANPLNQGDGFLARFDNNGNRLWASYYGGSSFDRFYDLAIDANSNIYATGVSSSDGLSTAGSFQPARGGNADILLVKFDNSGNRIWATYYGGNNEDYSEAITCDMQSNIIIGGTTSSTTGIATPGTYLPAWGGNIRDAFVVKFNAAGNRLWGTYYGGDGEDELQGMTNDVNNNIIITGWTYSTNNIATINSYESVFPATGASWTPYIAKLNSAGGRVWGTYYGYGNPIGNGRGEDVVTDNSGNVFACGETTAPNGVATCGAVQETWAGTNGNYDMYMAMFSETTVNPSVSVTISSTSAGSVCAGAPATFTALVLNAGTNPTYQWKVNGVNAGTNLPAFTTSSLNNGDQVSCTVTSNSPCLTNPSATSNIITIMISPSVVPSVSISSSPTGSICLGAPVIFTATPINGGPAPTYQWKINGNNAGTNNPVFSTTSLLSADIVSCEMTNLSSCNPITTATSNNITMIVTNSVTPSITIAATPPEICFGTTVSFSTAVVNAGNDPGYQWTLNGNIVGTNATYSISNLSTNDTVQCFLIPDNTISCLSANNIASNKLTVQVNPLPNFTIQLSNATIQKGDTVQFSVNATNISQYLWTPVININNTVIGNPMVWPDITQVYSLKATSSKGCVVEKSVTITVISGLFIPTAFTPNNDGKNDYWEIMGLELYPNCVVTVFNRWGETVYRAVGYSKPWDGRFKTEQPSTSTFVYMIDLKDGKRPLSGTVVVIK
jgi:gliding motility-associated-like protein